MSPSAQKRKLKTKQQQTPGQNSDWKPPVICWQAPELDTDSAQRGAALNLPNCHTDTHAHAHAHAHTTASNATDDNANNRVWVLSADGQGLYLKTSNNLVLRSNFGPHNAERRTSQSGFIHDTFAKAIGVARMQKTLSRRPRVIDATGGLGQDAMTLISLGCQLTVIERHPILHCLLADAMIRNDNATVVNDDANDALRSHATSINADVIYLDPMYPQQKRRGKSRKGMQVLHELLGPDTYNDTCNKELLSSALEACQACDGFRVVVKRPKGAAPLTGHDAWAGQITSISSPNTRYDIYHNRPLGGRQS